MANMLSDTTGRRITGLREREDMTLDELAAKIGINATTLGRIEKGQTQKINSDVLVALAREFNVSTDFLLGLTSIPQARLSARWRCRCGGTGAVYTFCPSQNQAVG